MSGNTKTQDQATAQAVDLNTMVRPHKAYLVKYPKLHGAGVYKSETASKARYCAYLHAKDCGVEVNLIDFIVRRAKEYDNYNIGRSGVSIEYVEFMRPNEEHETRE